MLQKALIVVDMQNDFVTGVLGTKEAQAIVPKIVEKVKEYHKAGLPVVFTKDTHFSETYMDSSEGIHLPVLHCVITTDGWQLVPELEAVRIPEDEVINKSTFGSKNLVHWAKVHDPASVEMCGVCTGICVVSNAVLLKTNLPGMEIYIDKNAVACVTPETNEAALTTLKCLQMNIME